MKKDPTREAIDKINRNREFRRMKMEQKRQIKLQKEVDNQEQGIKCDVDFQLMVEHEKDKVISPRPHEIPDIANINIWVRKRPLSEKEELKGEIDWISWTNPAILVHKWKLKVDGITKYIENIGFEFDNAFAEYESSDKLYYWSIQPQIDFLFDGGIVTCFAYGQTGSGKTYTMEAVQKLAVNDFFAGAEIMREETGKLFTFTVSFYEIYNGKIHDLLDNHKLKKWQEDSKGSIQIPQLKEVQARTADEMTQLIEYGLSERKTKSTAWNDTSSRSHAIATISIKQINRRNQIIADSGKLLLVDLAGSEKAQDSQSNIKQRRIEGAEINTSLLALKEWIRAMDTGRKHVPFRQSKLTMVLRDSFIGGKNKNHVIMIAWIAPDQDSSDHTLNTLRYAERLKYNWDDQGADKYMSSKQMTRKSPETSFHNFIYKEDESDDSKWEGSPYKNSQLYQSHEVSVHLTESNILNDTDLNDIEEDYSPGMKTSKYNEYKKPVNYENEHPSFNDSSNWIEINNQETKIYEPKNNKDEKVEVYQSTDVSNLSYYCKNKWYNDTSKTQSYNQIPTTKDIQVKEPRRYERFVSDWKEKVTGIELEDQFMHENMDDNEERQDPHLYISHSMRSGWETTTNVNKDSYSINPALFHSSSSSNLKCKRTSVKVPNFSKDKTSSSTSYINATRRLDRTKPTPSIELDLGSDKDESSK